MSAATATSETSTIPMPTSHQEYTALNRVGAIPIVHSFVDALINAVNANSVTRYGYTTATAITTTAYKYAEPYQDRVAPYLHRADQLANSGIDAAQQRFPSAFETKPEEIADYVRIRTQSASEYVNQRRASARASASKVIDEKVKAPAYNVAQNIDQGCTKVVDVLETVVTRLGSDGKAPAVETQYQYQRAIALSKTLKDNMLGYSAEQWKQIQAHSALVSAATETAHSLGNAASKSLASAQSQIHELQTRVHDLSNNMLTQLHTLQTSATKLAQDTYQNSTSQIHSRSERMQQKYHESAAALGALAREFQVILKEDSTVQVKLEKIRSNVQERISPVLEGMKKAISRSPSFSSSSSESSETLANGNGHIE